MDAIYTQALELLTNGQLEKAENLYKQIIFANSNMGIILSDMGVIHFMREEYEIANKFYEASLIFDSRSEKTHLNYANCLRAAGHVDEAEQHYNLSREYAKDVDWCLRILEQTINMMLEKGRREEAKKYWEKVVETSPNNSPSIHNYANFLQEVMDEFSEACKVYSSINAKGGYANTAQLYNDWAIALKNIGAHEQAMSLYERSIGIQPYAHIYSNMLYDLLFPYGQSELQILEKHKQYALMFASEKKYGHAAVREDSERSLRIAYISPDFRYHSVGMFFFNILKHHNHDEYEIFCYYTCPVEEAETLKFKQHSCHWRHVAASHPDELAKIIHEDKIDILIDLAGHTRGNSMLAFLRKPAPIQMTWIGYTFSTGLDTIDYFITDETAVPKGTAEESFSEKLLRIPDCFLCYTPHEELPEVSDTPAKAAEKITFGLYGNFAKINRFSVDMYAKILHCVENSQILIQSASMNDSGAREYLYKLFDECGISQERLIIRKKVENPEEYLKSFNEIDILLDWHPFNGETITCNALSMGIPVVSLYGSSHRSRAGLSILKALGKEKWATDSTEKFVKIAVALSGDVKKLNLTRKKLRKEFLNSPICDAERFTLKLENAYRECWRSWCLD